MKFSIISFILKKSLPKWILFIVSFPPLCSTSFHSSALKIQPVNNHLPSSCWVACGVFMPLSGSKALMQHLHGGLWGFCCLSVSESLSPFCHSIGQLINQSIHCLISFLPSSLNTQSLQHELFWFLVLLLSFGHYLRMNSEPSCSHNYKYCRVRQSLFSYSSLPTALYFSKWRCLCSLFNSLKLLSSSF